MAMLQPLDTAERDEGVIKFNAQWKKTPPFPEDPMRGLFACRDVLRQHGLIGQYDDGIAYGNISQRIGTSSAFYITGSATGGIQLFNENHIARVDSVDIESNRLFCSGPVIASSESMTHAALYQCDQNINSIIHVHHHDLWKSLMHQVPTTADTIEYGTPLMAHAVIELYGRSDLQQKKILVMAGHEDGVFVFGSDLITAKDRLMDVFTGIDPASQ